MKFDQIKSAFEVGCGDGFATYYFDKEIDLVEGGDISENMISNNPVDKDRLKIIDAEDLNLPDESYDLVYTWEVLHHVQDPQKAVKEMARVAKKYVVIFEPNNMNILQIGFALLNKEERGTLRSSKNFLENLCENSNLKVTHIDYCCKIPPNLTPFFAFNWIKRMSFVSTIFTGISIAVIAEKQP